VFTALWGSRALSPFREPLTPPRPELVGRTSGLGTRRLPYYRFDKGESGTSKELVSR